MIAPRPPADDPHDPSDPSTQPAREPVVAEAGPDDDVEMAHLLPPDLPSREQFDALVGAHPALTPDLSLDLALGPQIHFLGEQRGEPVTVRLSENLSKMIDWLIQAKSTGYRTKSEFLRDAAFHLTRALVDLHHINDPRLTSYLVSADIAAKADFAARLRDQITQAEHDLTDYLLAVVERGGIGEARRVIDRYEHDARQIPIAWWRDQWLRVLTTNPLVVTLRGGSAAQTPQPAAS